MVRQLELHDGVDASIDNSDTPRKVSRRAFVVGAGVAAATVGLAGGIAKFTRVGEAETAPHRESLPTDRVVVINGVEVNIDQIDMPNLYTNPDPSRPDLYRPWANPEHDINLSIDERKEAAAIVVSPEMSTDEGITLLVGQQLERIANAARHPEEYFKFHSQGAEASWDDYVRRNFINPMIDGLFSIKYDDPRFAGADRALEDLFIEFADEYEVALRREEWRDKVTLYVNTHLVDSYEEYSNTPERSIVMGMELKRLSYYENTDDVVFSGEMIVSIDPSQLILSADEEVGGKRIDAGIQYLHLTRQ